MKPFARPFLHLIVRHLLVVSPTRFTVLFLLVAVVVSVLIVLTIDLSWDSRLNAELEFAGVVTPLLDALFLVVFLNAMLGELRREVVLRERAEADVRHLNRSLEETVSERTRQLLAAQEELVRQERLATLGQVAGSVGHELRNPLGVMSNAVYFLQTLLSDADETTKEYLGIIESEIAGAERIVADLLDSVRTTPPRPERVPLDALVAQVLAKYAVPAAVTVRVDVAPELAWRADPHQMAQVLRNLFSNACEAMPAGGALEIRASEDAAGKTVTVTVRDSGTGISPEQMARLFQPLFTTKPCGIGLGLVVVKNLTEANGGVVTVTSEVGRGTLFRITLPAMRKEGA